MKSRRKENNRRKERLSEKFENFAMTDIVMNLFIFFVITFSLLYTFRMVKLTLPDSKQEEEISGILISITEDDKIYLNEEYITSLDEQDFEYEDASGNITLTPKEELLEPLKELLGDEPQNARVIIRADKNLPYKKVEKVVNTVVYIGPKVMHLAIHPE